MTDEQEPIAEHQEMETESEGVEVDEQIDQPEDDEPINLDAQEEDQESEEGEQDQDDDLEAEPEGEAESEESEFVTLEIDGQEYEVPAALKDGYMRHKDYTQKTQAAAEMRKELDQQKQMLEQQSQATEQELQDRVTALNIKERLEEYANVDWDAAEQQDPLEAQKHWRIFQQLKEQNQEVQGRLDNHAKERTEKAEQETVTRLQETLKFAQTNIKGWTPELDTKIASFATQELGFTPDTLKQAYNPQVYQTLYLAFLGQQSLKNQATAKPKQKVAPKPLKRVTAKASPNVKKSLEDMSMEEYAAHRKKQLGAA